jgi:DNA-binding CsgD family transcriptional regulator
MRRSRSTLSETTIAILELIAAGQNYDQILDTYPKLKHWDIRMAAEEALALSGAKPRRTRRERYPRAHEKWTKADESLLRRLIRSGATVARIAGQLQRDREAIRSHILKLGLLGQLTPGEAERFRDIVGLGRANQGGTAAP